MLLFLQSLSFKYCLILFVEKPLGLEEKKEARDKAKLEKYIDSRLDYAKDSIALAVMAAQEAKVAFLEAIEAQSEYEELYGEKAKKEEK